MVKIKTVLRHMAFVFMICLACMVPMPLVFRKKDKLPQKRVEQVDKEQEEDREDIKELF